MATQWMSMATLGGRSAVAVTAQFEQWLTVPDPDALDQLCMALRGNALSLSVVYFTEWVDRWLTGDAVPGPEVVAGHRYQAACLSVSAASAD